MWIHSECVHNMIKTYSTQNCILKVALNIWVSLFVSSLTVVREKEDIFEAGVKGEDCQYHNAYWKTATSCKCQYNPNTYYSTSSADNSCHLPSAGKHFEILVIVYIQ